MSKQPTIKQVFEHCDLAIEAAKEGKRLKAFQRLLEAASVAEDLVRHANRVGRYWDYSGAPEAVAEAAFRCRLYCLYPIAEHSKTLAPHQRPEIPGTREVCTPFLSRGDSLWCRWSNNEVEESYIPRLRPCM